MEKWFLICQVVFERSLPLLLYSSRFCFCIYLLNDHGLKHWKPDHVFKYHPILKVVTKKCIALEYRTGLPLKALYRFLLSDTKCSILLPHWKISCTMSPSDSTHRVRSKVPAFVHLTPFVATCCTLTGKKEAAAGHAPDLRWAVASIVGKTMNRQPYFGSHSSLFKSILHSPAVPQLLCIWERTCQLLRQLYLHLLLLCSNQGR